MAEFLGANRSSWVQAPLHIDALVQRGDTPLCGPVQALMQAGEVWQVLGPNGTGKTTLLLMLAGVLPVFDGELHWGGEPPSQWPVLWLGHQAGCSALLSVADNLAFLAALGGGRPDQEALHAALAQVGLAGYEQVRVATLSAGQKRRVALAQLWLPGADAAALWLLDEPLTALDVGMVARLERRVQGFVQGGGRVVLTSHQALRGVTHRLDLTAMSGVAAGGANQQGARA